MKMVFADTCYWVAIVNPKDQLWRAAHQARAAIGDIILLTTDEVLSEFLTALSRYGEDFRRSAVKAVNKILSDPNVKVTQQSRDSFLQGIKLYENRPDKSYSLTDCISMNAMRSQNVMEALTNDHHFEQEGFKVLIASH